MNLIARATANLLLGDDSIALNDFPGSYWLDAVDQVSRVTQENAVLTIRLDGICFTFIEDPDDGYRSHMSDIQIEKNYTPKNTFQPLRVTAHINSNGLLEFYANNHKEPILTVGTDHTDDYYPICIASWNPPRS